MNDTHTMKTETITAFEEDVMEGLTSYPKYLHARYFYDEKGDELFQQIMELPEYYLTRTEYEIFNEQKAEIIDAFDPFRSGFDLIELGAGDGLKTKLLLEQLLKENRDFTYMPIDISQNALNGLEKDLKETYPSLDVNPKQGEYFEVLEDLERHSHRPKVIMFLGSNIGNLEHRRAIQFLHHLYECLHDQDQLFIGFDLKKDPKVIEAAYNDSRGVTAAFNLNLLYRINREMDADFDPSAFLHKPIYDPETGTAKSFLVSSVSQDVYIGKLDRVIHFDQWESIHMEISQKYDEQIIEWLLEQSGLKTVKVFRDSQKWFANYLLAPQR